MSLADEADLTTFYVTERGKPIDQGVLNDYSHRFFEEGAGKEASSLWSMRAKLRDKGTRQFLDNLLVFSTRQTPHLNQQTADVIDR
ncbi:hypothetical protein JZU48_01610, partial [bacterium]|nr:hypothetical protein [bacterium]